MRKRYSSARLVYRLSDPVFAKAAAEFFERNRVCLEVSEDKKPEEFYLPAFQEIWLDMQREQAEKKEWYVFYIFEKRKPGRVIGTVSISGIQYGNLCSAKTGYRIDADYQGRGFGTEALKEATRIGFEELSLHRIEADVMPENKASVRVLEKCGYEKEGYLREYMRINGRWEDHIRMAALNPEGRKA